MAHTVQQNSYLKNQSMGATFSAPAINASAARTLSIGATWDNTDSPVGTLIVEVSQDGTNWQTYTGSSFAISAAGTQIYELTAAPSNFYRLKYTRTSGGGGAVMDAQVTLKY